MSDDADKDELEIVSDETIKSRVASHNLWNSKIATLLSVCIISFYALIGIVVLVMAFLSGREPPSWAMAIESSAITGALAVIFKEHLPSGRR